MKICTQCGLFRCEDDDQGCQCQPNEHGELPEVEEFDMNELSDDGYDGDEHSDYPTND